MPGFFATCARGLEPILARELESFGSTSVVEGRGGVHFQADQKTLYNTHLWSRTANRVLYPLRESDVRDAEEVYDFVYSFRWETFFKNPETTLAVDCTISGQANESFRNSHFVRLRVKDAIVDRLRDKKGDRPNIDTENPDVSVYLYIRSGKATLGLDATGTSLHERGYRALGFTAPLKETLAAGILELTNWHVGMPLYDPFCGSGTFLIEAAMRAADIAPGLARHDFLFKHWPEFHEKLWRDCVEEAKSRKRAVPEGLFFGSDASNRSLTDAKESAGRAGLNAKTIQWQRADVLTLEAAPCEAKGVFVCNPPYGERLGEEEELKPLYKGIGDTMKKKFQGWTGFILTGNSTLAKCVGLRTARKIPLFNGAIECRLLRYDLY